MSSPNLSGPKDSWSDEQKWQYLIRHERLGELLVRQGKLTIDQLDKVLQEQKSSKKHVGEILVAQKIMSLDEILSALENQKLINDKSTLSIEELKRKAKKK